MIVLAIADSALILTVELLSGLADIEHELLLLLLLLFTLILPLLFNRHF